MSSRTSPAPMYSIEAFVGDRSGSMHTMGDAPAEGARKFLMDRRKFAQENDVNGHFICTTFDSYATVVFNKPIKNISDSDIELAVKEMAPRDLTRLIDTVYETIESMIKRIHDFKKSLSPEALALNPEIKAICAILTDGEDNESERTNKQLNDIIKKFKKEYNGVVLFLAANQDSIKTGSKFGLTEGECINFSSTSQGSCNVMKSVTNAVDRFYTSDCTDYRNVDHFTQDERLTSSCLN